MLPNRRVLAGCDIHGFFIGGRMAENQKETWLELCELTAKEHDPGKLLAFIAEIDHLSAVEGKGAKAKLHAPRTAA